MKISTFLIYSFLFFSGSVIGWIIELLYRKFISDSNPEHRWVNPGMCTGPYLPIYGCGLCILYTIANFEKYNLFSSLYANKTVLFICMAVCMTVVEYVAGVLSLRLTKVRLWDYTNEWANLQGIICPKYSLFWGILGAFYYFFIHAHITDAIKWFTNNVEFSFFIGIFFGVFAIDLAHSIQLIAKIRKFAAENNLVVRYENFKAHVHERNVHERKKYNIFRPFRSDVSFGELLDEFKAAIDSKRKK